MGAFRRGLVLLSFEQEAKQISSDNKLILQSLPRRIVGFDLDHSAKLNVLPELYIARLYQRRFRYSALVKKDTDGADIVNLTRLKSIVRAQKDRDITAEFQDRMAEKHYFDGDIDQEITARLEVVSSLKGEDEDVSHALALNALGSACFRRGDDRGAECIAEAADGLPELIRKGIQEKWFPYTYQALMVQTLTRLHQALYYWRVHDVPKAAEVLAEILTDTETKDGATDVYCAAAYVLGKMYLQEGRQEEAIQEWRKIYTVQSKKLLAAESAFVFVGMGQVELGHLALNNKRYDVAEACFEAARTILMEKVCNISVRRLPAVVGLAQTYLAKKEPLVAEGLFNRVDDDLTKAPVTGLMNAEKAKQETDLGKMSSPTVAQLWSDSLRTFASYLRSPDFHESPRTTEADQCDLRAEELQHRFKVLALWEESMPPHWFFDVLFPRLQLTGTSGLAAITTMLAKKGGD